MVNDEVFEADKIFINVATIITAEDGTFRSLALLITLSNLNCDVSTKTKHSNEEQLDESLANTFVSPGVVPLSIQRSVWFQPSLKDFRRAHAGQTTSLRKCSRIAVPKASTDSSQRKN